MTMGVVAGVFFLAEKLETITKVKENGYGKVYWKFVKICETIYKMTILERGIYMRLYRKNLKDFIRFAGEPSKGVIRDNIELIVSMLFLLCAIMIWNFNDSRIVVALGCDKGVGRVVAIATLIGFAYVMIVCRIIILNKQCWSKSEKIVSSKKCWFVIKLLFAVIFFLITIRDILLYVLGRPKQKIIKNYILEISVAFVLSWILVININSLVSENTYFLYAIWGEQMTIRIVCLMNAIMYFGLFFALGKGLTHITIYYEVKKETKRRLKEVGIVTISKWLKKFSVKRQMNKRRLHKKKCFDKEFKQTKLLFYVLTIILLLLMPININNPTETIFVDQFMGVATLAALLREVENK